MNISAFSFAGEGMQRVYENEKWTVGIKNWKPANDISGIDMLERHNETDELFVLLQGSCTLVSAIEENGKLIFDKVVMVTDKVYNIPSTLWHNTITTQDTKMVLIEDVSTGANNSEFYTLSAQEIKAIQTLVE